MNGFEWQVYCYSWLFMGHSGMRGQTPTACHYGMRLDGKVVVFFGLSCWELTVFKSVVRAGSLLAIVYTCWIVHVLSFLLQASFRLKTSICNWIFNALILLPSRIFQPLWIMWNYINYIWNVQRYTGRNVVH